MLTITKKFKFEAAHKLPNHDGLCQQLHGHTYHLEVEVKGVVIDESSSPALGMIVDFGQLKKMVKAGVLDKLDHSYLNDFMHCPTAENLVVWIVQALYEPVEGLGIETELVRVRLYETENSYAEWKRDE